MVCRDQKDPPLLYRKSKETKNKDTNETFCMDKNRDKYYLENPGKWSL